MSKYLGYIVTWVCFMLAYWAVWAMHKDDDKASAEAPAPAPKPALVQRVRLYSATGVMIGEYHAEGPILGSGQYGHYFTDASTGRRVEFTTPYVSETVAR